MDWDFWGINEKQENTIKKTLTVLTGYLVASGAVAAGFDCDKAHGNIEKMICADSELSALDSELLPIYQQARKATNNSQSFKDNGKQALHWRSEHCKDKACLVKWYQDRKAELSAMIKPQKKTKQSSNEHCVTDGKEITLTGTMKIGQFAGPPNFESVKDSDKLLTYWYLETPKPLCTVTDSSLEGKTLEKIEPQSRFQLVISQQLDQLNQLFNQKASVTALPFTAHTGYHQTPLVLDVKHLEKED